MAVVSMVLSCMLLVVVQYYHIVHRVLELRHELAVTRREIADLRYRDTRKMEDIRRLSDPRGVVPEIHDRLRLVGANEMFIYVQGSATPAPSL
jgi:cell division protein FtsB